jgi:hypothetical protein
MSVKWVKWKNFKVILRTSAGINEPIVKPQMPIVYDLINDPGERWNLWEQSMDMGWVFTPVYQQVVAFAQSVAKYPNIKTGQDFSGY